MTTSTSYGGGTVTWTPETQRVFQIFRVPDSTQMSPHIVTTPGVLDGKPRIVGRRIAVQHVVVWHTQLGMPVEEIAHQYDLSPDAVRDALTYYQENRAAIDEAIHSENALVAEMQQRYPPKRASELKARLNE